MIPALDTNDPHQGQATTLAPNINNPHSPISESVCNTEPKTQATEPETHTIQQPLLESPLRQPVPDPYEYPNISKQYDQRAPGIKPIAADLHNLPDYYQSHIGASYSGGLQIGIEPNLTYSPRPPNYPHPDVNTAYSIALQNSQALKDRSNRSERSKVSKASSITSLKIQLAADAAAARVEREFVQERAEQDELDAKAEADFLRQKADFIQAQVKRDALRKQQELDMIDRKNQAQRKVIDEMEEEMFSQGSTMTSEIPEITQEGKTEAYLTDIASNMPPLSIDTNPLYTPDFNQDTITDTAHTYLYQSLHPRIPPVPNTKPQAPVYRTPKHTHLPAVVPTASKLEPAIPLSDTTTARLQFPVHTRFPTAAVKTKTQPINHRLLDRPPSYKEPVNHTTVEEDYPCEVRPKPKSSTANPDSQTPRLRTYQHPTRVHKETQQIKTLKANIETPRDYYHRTEEISAPPLSPRRQVIHSGLHTTEVSSSYNTSLQSNSDIKAVCDQMALSRLPIMEPQIFTGHEPLVFPVWKMSFDTLIDHKALTPAERLHFLSRYVGGPAKEAIQGFFPLSPALAYENSYQLLIKRYGDQYKLATSYRQKLKTWSKIGSSDGPGLRSLVDFLRQCRTAMMCFQSLSILDDESENAEICRKLPAWLSRNWTRKVAIYRSETGEFPPFSDFVDFLALEDDIANDPYTQTLQKDNIGNVKNTENRSGAFATESSPNGSAFGGCPLCKKRHPLNSCDDFKKISLQERQKFIREFGLCYGCLNRGHLIKACRNRQTCGVCRGNHPTVMHREAQPELAGNATVSASSCAGHNNTNRTLRKSAMIVPVVLTHQDNPKREVITYAMLDTQSDTSFITEEMADALGLEGKETRLILSTMTTRGKTVSCRRFDRLEVKGVYRDQNIPLPTVYSRQSIPANRQHIPNVGMIDEWPHLEPLRNRLMPVTDNQIGLLIGYDCQRALAPREVLRAPGTSDGPFGMLTDLGWGIVGVIGYSADFQTDQIGLSCRILAMPVTGSQIVVPSRIKEIVSPADCLKALEADFTDKGHDEEGSSADERHFLRTMEHGIEVDSTNHYSMPLPFNRRKHELFNNRMLVVNRSTTLKRKFIRDPQYKEEYCGFMRDMFERGFAEEVPYQETQDNSEVWYIPHFGVYHKIKKKLRVVFDCSAQYKGISLNDTLLKGPDYMNLLIGILCRFRREPIAFCCDIEKMFYAFHVHVADRNYLRFLWWENGDISKPLKTFRMTSHIFGAISSPSCATYGLRAIASEFEEVYGNEVSEFVGNEFYVDDGLKSIKSPVEAISLIRRTVMACKERGVRLHKFTSNSKEVLDSIPTTECAVEKSCLDLDREDQNNERVLGMLWNMKTDVFQFRIRLEDCPTTRRKILSRASSVFDPLGWISPFTLRAKVVLQRLCKEGLDWDEDASPEVLKSWTDWCGETTLLHRLNITRGFHHKDYESDVSIQLHHFSDASSYAYGACSYIRIVDNKGRITVNLVMSKARVAPIASMTIPRLELMAAVVAARLSTLLDRELKIEGVNHYFWTDSRIVLGYLANDSKRFKVYVANRVQEVHNASSPTQWRYVASQENPADLASRGMSAEDLTKSQLWFHGPSFLHKKDMELMENIPISVVLDDQDQEVRKVIANACMVMSTEVLSMQIFNSFSSWKALRRGVARAKLLAKYWRSLLTKGVKTRSSNEIDFWNLSVSDLQESEDIIIKSVQNSYFSEEINMLLSKNDLPKGNSLQKLSCFVDETGVLRVGGRLRFANHYPNYKHPVLLPGAAHVSTLIIRQCHQETKHQGRGMTTNEIRARGFWILGLSSRVKKLIHSCVICRFLRGTTQTQQMSDLPPDRAECAPPFTYCGVDFFGPFLVREKRSEVKRYGAIFTCLASRAVHIEMAYALTTDAFIQSLRKFLAIRGPIRLLRCDNGTNFVGANRELTKSVAAIHCEDLKRFLLEQDSDFEFQMNPPSASHMGGAWERLIRVIRSILSTLMDQHGSRLNDSSLSTFLYEAAAIANTRPLSLEYITDPEHPEPLTPNHLLTGKSRVVLPPPGQFCQEDTYGLKRWRCVQYLADQFWDRWRKEYLCYLQLRHKWTKRVRDMKVGDVVLVQDDNASRNDWKKGLIIKTQASKDGQVRQARLKINAGRGEASELTRPIHKLVLLLPSEH